MRQLFLMITSNPGNNISGLGMNFENNKTLEYIQTALELSRELDDNKEESYCLMNMATAK
ncbi:MAG: hypothetical protein P9X26_08695 [Candidatus Stygibacter frigidus]|nr:hypothetical protein [Candidatus Stygibacter frigidus]